MKDNEFATTKKGIESEHSTAIGINIGKLDANRNSDLEPDIDKISSKSKKSKRSAES